MHLDSIQKNNLKALLEYDQQYLLKVTSFQKHPHNILTACMHQTGFVDWLSTLHFRQFHKGALKQVLFPSTRSAIGFIAH